MNYFNQFSTSLLKRIILIDINEVSLLASIKIKIFSIGTWFTTIPKLASVELGHLSYPVLKREKNVT